MNSSTSTCGGCMHRNNLGTCSYKHILVKAEDCACGDYDAREEVNYMLMPAAGGWIPGERRCICQSCGKPYHGSKKSYNCAKCAYTKKEVKPFDPFDL